MSEVSEGIHDVNSSLDHCDSFAYANTTVGNPFDELITKLHTVINTIPQESVSYTMQTNSYYRAMFSVLCDKKLPQIPKDDSANQRIREQSEKLDHMINEFYQYANEECTSSSLDDDHSFLEYKTTLQHIREELVNHSGRMAQHSGELYAQLRDTLERQKICRPISTLDEEKSLGILDEKHTECQNELKQIICHKLMLSRSKLDESRKKRRNFSKHATKILTKYFNSHVDSPYPSEEDKAKLAVECNITVAQVSNWFGNKRIRFKRSLNSNEQVPPQYDVVPQHAQFAQDHPYSDRVYNAQNSFACVTHPSVDPRSIDYNYAVQMQSFDGYPQMTGERYSGK